MSNKISLSDLEKAAHDYVLYEYKESGRDLIWTMKDHTEIMIKDMKDSHVKNTINMLKRKPDNGTRGAWVEIFVEETLYRRSKKIEKIKDNIDLDDLCIKKRIDEN